SSTRPTVPAMPSPKIAGFNHNIARADLLTWPRINARRSPGSRCPSSGMSSNRQNKSMIDASFARAGVSRPYILRVDRPRLVDLMRALDDSAAVGKHRQLHRLAIAVSLGRESATQQKAIVRKRAVRSQPRGHGLQIDCSI